MQAASVAALTIALALGTTVATTTFYLQQVDLVSEPPADISGLEAEVRRLRKECADLRRRLASAPLQESRREVAALGEEQIGAAIRGWLEKHGHVLEGLAAEASAGKTVQVDEKQAFLTLTDLEVPYDQRLKVWRQVQKAGKLDELLARLREHASKSPNDADAHTALGHALVQKINSPDVSGLDRAVLGNQIDQAFAKALEIDPEHWEARYSRAIGLTYWPSFMGKRTEAIENFETLIEQQERRSPQPGYASTYLLLGNVYAEQGKTDKAREVWQRGLRQFPDDEKLRARLNKLK